MQVVILAAGRGKRMGGLTSDTAKPMLKIKGAPILEHKINALPKKIKEIVFVVGYYSMDIISHFKNYFNGRPITYVFQSDLNGTGGALHLAKSILKDKFLVMMGDDLYLKKDLTALLKHDLAVLCHETDEAQNFGIVKMNRVKNMTGITEKPKNMKKGMANAGVYVLDKKFFEYDLVPVGKGEFGLPQTMAKMAKDHKIKVHEASFWHPIGRPGDLKKAEEIIDKFI